MQLLCSSSLWARLFSMSELSQHRKRGELKGSYSCADAEELGMKPCKFAEKVWNAQQAGAVGVSCRLLGLH